MTQIHVLIAIAIALQSIELIMLRTSFSNTGVWRWSTLRAEWTSNSPSWLLWVYDRTFSEKGFLFLLEVRLLAACLLPIWPNIFLLLFLAKSTLLIAMRWRGTFNGGSDTMTFHILIGVLAAAVFPYDNVVEAAIWYIAVQVCLSYFVSGFAKLKSASWRDGSALPIFLSTTIYGPQKIHSSLAKFAAWAVILFECTFPLALLNTNIAVGYIAVALAFHWTNWYVFGLNRFFWAWLAAYPALVAI